MDIYWIKDKQRCGPATVPDIVARLQMGELTPETKGWHTGVQGWKPLRELPALADFMDKPESVPQPPPLPRHVSEKEEPADPAIPGGEQDGQEPYPRHVDTTSALKMVNLRTGLASASVRFLARLVDLFLYMTAAMACLYLFKQPLDSLFSPYGGLFWLPMILLEAYSLSKWGSTPGKRIMGVEIWTTGDKKGLPFNRALMRSLFVYVFGMGMMMPYLNVIAMLFACWMLRSRGICWWDARMGTLPVSAKKPTISRVIFSLGSIYFSMVLTAFFMMPWVPQMYDIIRENNPDWAKYLPPIPTEEHADKEDIQTIPVNKQEKTEQEQEQEQPVQPEQPAN